MRILVMGGSRLMGLLTVLELARRDHEVIVFNRGTRAVQWPVPVQEIRGDRDVPKDLAVLGDLPLDGLIDFSAYSARQTELLLEVVRSVPRFVHCSTGAVYSPAPTLPWAEKATPTGPWPVWGAYGAEKLRSEELLRERRDGDRLATVLMRPPMVLAPRNYVPREEWVLNRLLDGAEILVPGDGRAVAHFVSARQVAIFAANSVEAFAGGGVRAFNVAEPSAMASALGFIELCARIAGREARIRHVAASPEPFIVADNVFPFPNENYVLSTRAAEAAGLQPPAESVEAMIREAYDDLLDDPARRTWSRSPAETAALDALT